MVRIIGLTTIIVFLAAGINWLGAKTNSNFINDVLEKEILSIMATILGLNLATASFLLSSITNVEIKIGTSCFRKSKKEIKENLYFMIVLMLLTLIILVIDPSAFTKFASQAEYAKQVLIITLVLFYLYAFWEMTNGIFQINSMVKEIEIPEEEESSKKE